ncbi:hypothetical protein B0J13DRAFT_611831 [Dactylonectria estremocensis]|uniref:FAD-binding domain-containing protein n=1 Tax=Dactylonectria estremocensis TaxID=1079267 RepID=A0A9P9DW42_9HYPO|nr:hypothetical protein B0J13DRAFT_611831 [Dactylonectria estremocensis]
MQDTMLQQSLKNLDVIVIGAGFGGLAASIELAQRGAKVIVFESYPDMKKQGDVIQVPANGTRLIKRWGNVLEKIVSISASPEIMSIMDKKGKVLLDQQLHTDFDGFPIIYGHRGRIQHFFYDFAVSLGVEVKWGASVGEIFENDVSAGVLTDDGKKYEADLVIAADGVHSRSRSFVVETADRPRKSGFAVYRSWFPLPLLQNDPVTRDIANSEKPLFKIWIAEDTHGILTTNPALQSATCFVTHKDLSDVTEDWNLRGDVGDMLACVKDWDPELRHIIEKIPSECLIDYKLLWRDPVSKWVSRKGRVCLIGDAAHPHLATSGTGAAQAIEDAATIGALLEQTGKAKIQLALKSYEKLRYGRTSLTQRMGWETRHVWHQTNWDAVAANPDMLKFPQPAWLLGSDAKDYAEENFEAVKASIENGTPFVSTNVPLGHVHEDWTIETMLAHEGKLADKNFYKTRD